MTKYLNGQKFFYRLVEPFDTSGDGFGKDYLYQEISPTDNKLIICYSQVVTGSRKSPRRNTNSVTGNNNNTATSGTTANTVGRRPGKVETVRLFTYFNNYCDFARFMLRFRPENRHFYEIIESNFQKPKFDIEIEDGLTEMQQVLDDLIHAIIIVLSEFGVYIDLERDLLLYSSHGPRKQSCHIVIDNYCHTDHLQAEGFYKRVIRKIHPSIVKYVDASVYSKRQQFRILGSQKPRSDRPKSFWESWQYDKQIYQHKYVEPPDDAMHKFMLQLSASLVTNAEYCQILPNFAKVQLEPKRWRYGGSSYGGEDGDEEGEEELTQDMAMEALQLLAKKAKLSISDARFPYRFKAINNGIIVLNRIRPSMCRMCKRVHQNENPFFYIMGKNGSVYFNCRRNDQNMFVGNLTSSTSSVSSDNNDNNNNNNKNKSPAKKEAEPINFNKPLPNIQSEAELMAQARAQSLPPRRRRPKNTDKEADKAYQTSQTGQTRQTRNTQQRRVTNVSYAAISAQNQNTNTNAEKPVKEKFGYIEPDQDIIDDILDDL